MSNYLITFPLTLHSCCIECEQRRDLTKLNKRLKDEKNEIQILVGVYFLDLRVELKHQGGEDILKWILGSHLESLQEWF